MKTSNTIGGILLVSGTAIGGGILALPTSTVAAGFIPTSISFIICWFFMTIGALLLLEANLWFKNETNLISMSHNTIGTKGKIFAWITYLMLLYALISAYLTGCGAWVVKIAKDTGLINIPTHIGPLVVAIVMGIIIYCGTYYVDRLNRILAFGLFLFFALIIGASFHYVDYSALTLGDFKAAPRSVPLIITSFGFAIVIPSLCHYLKNETKSLLAVVLVGSLIPLICYLVWELVTLGSLSIAGPNGLKALALNIEDGTEVAVALQNVIGNKIITTSALFFSIFAIVTSLIGVTLSLFHFLADGLHLKKRGLSGVFLFILTFTPPLIAITVKANGFNVILSFGGIFVAIILGILPIMMVWYGRYVRKIATDFRVPGGKFLLITTGIFFLYVIMQELTNIFI